ncbi:MAG TPA: hypothetical protein DCS05_09410 [Nitrospiraceae bacterium]|nr:hypothetical protein [Nitrospiraceae bacterium]
MKPRALKPTTDLTARDQAEHGKETTVSTRLVLPKSLHERLQYYCDNNGGRSNSMTRFINAAIEERLDQLEPKK